MSELSFPKFCERHFLTLQNNTISNNVLLLVAMVLLVQICRGSDLLLLSSSPVNDFFTGLAASLMILGVGLLGKTRQV